MTDAALPDRARPDRRAGAAGPTRIAVIHASDKGGTRALAAALTEGAGMVPGVAVALLDVDDATADHITGSHGIAFGSPVHMGGMHWRAKRFVDRVCGPLWKTADLRGRLCTVFATGGGYGGAGGGAELAMIGMLSNFVQLGMTVVPLGRATPGFAAGGSAWGPYARTNDEAGAPIPPAEGALGCARAHGRRFAEAVHSAHAAAAVAV